MPPATDTKTTRILTMMMMMMMMMVLVVLMLMIVMVVEVVVKIVKHTNRTQRAARAPWVSSPDEGFAPLALRRSNLVRQTWVTQSSYVEDPYDNPLCW